MSEQEAHIELGYGKGLIWLLFAQTGPPLPPYLLEVVMKTGQSYYIHSPNVRDVSRRSIVLNVYDFRAIDDQAEQQIKAQLDEDPWSKDSEPKDLHPLLTIGRLRCDLDDIAYCVEWLSRWWRLESLFPDLSVEKKRSLGFDLPYDTDSAENSRQ